MAVEQTQVLPAPVLEAALTAFTQKLPPLMGSNKLIRQHTILKLQHKHNYKQAHRKQHKV